MRRRRPRQLRLFPAPPRPKRRGRPPKAGAGVSHHGRPFVDGKITPVHVTYRVRRHVWNLRSRRSFRALDHAFWAARDRFETRLCHFSIQGNHLHLIVEAKDASSLSRAMQGLAIRMARALNRMMRRRGKVFADRFHARVLRTLPEVRSALRYVVHNHAHHARAWGGVAPQVDPFTSVGCGALLPAGCALPIARPEGWPLRRATRELRARAP